MRIQFTLAAFGLAALPSAFAWGAAGHEIVATIAQLYTHPDTLSVLCDILHPSLNSSTHTDGVPCHLAPIASWADSIKREPAYRYTSVLHYINARDDHPPDACAFPGSHGWVGRSGGNILGAISNVSSILGAYVGSTREGQVAIQQNGETAGSEALKFLVHYLGDLHQPLHLIGRERGGNGAKVTFDGRVTCKSYSVSYSVKCNHWLINAFRTHLALHGLWDSYLIAQRIRTLPLKYSHPISGPDGFAIERHLRGTIYDSYIRRLMHEGFGVGLTKGAKQRFSDWAEWSNCPLPESEKNTSGWLGSVQKVLVSGWKRLAGNEDWDNGNICPYAWASEIHKMNCEFPIWPRELEFTSSSDALLEVEGRRPRPHPDLLELDTPEYAGRLRDEWVVERLVATGGVRLATILNGLVLGVWEPVSPTRV